MMSFDTRTVEDTLQQLGELAVVRIQPISQSQGGDIWNQ